MKSLLLPALILASTLAGCADGVNKHPILNTYFDEIEKGNPVDCNSVSYTHLTLPTTPYV